MLGPHSGGAVILVGAISLITILGSAAYIVSLFI